MPHLITGYHNKLQQQEVVLPNSSSEGMRRNRHSPDSHHKFAHFRELSSQEELYKLYETLRVTHS